MKNLCCNIQIFEISKKIGNIIEVARIPEIITNHDLFEPLVKLIEIVNDDDKNINDYPESEIGFSSKFSNIHSSIDSGLNSDVDEESFLELEKKVSEIAIDLEKNENEKNSLYEKEDSKKEDAAKCDKKNEVKKKNSLGNSVLVIDKRNSFAENAKRRNSFRDKVGNVYKNKGSNEFSLDFSTKFSDPTQSNTDRVIKIEIPPASYVRKARNCSRGCPKEKCTII